MSALAITGDLGRVRRFVVAHAGGGLVGERLADLLIAANEAATNTLAHGRDGVIRVWRDEHGLVCEIADAGRIADPLAGRRRPDHTSDHGRGLWLMHQLCDLVQVRSAAAGTTVRLHMRLS